MINWNDDWRTELKRDSYEVWERLAECRNTYKDLIIMTKLVCKYNPDILKGDCLDRILEWVTEWNNQWILYPKTLEEYDRLLSKI